MKPLIVLLALFLGGMALAPSPAAASDYCNGYCEDGYTYRDGYWWKGGCAYCREKVYWYDRCGHCYYYWRYSKVPFAERVVERTVETVKSSDPDWRGKLLDIAAARDRTQGEIQKGQAEQNYFVQAVGALGLTGNFNIQNYGAFPLGGTLGQSFQLSAAGVQGNTVYGYQGYNQTADLYGSTDMNALYQQASRLTQNAQTLAGQAATDFSGLATQAGGNHAKVAEILAKGQAVQAMAKAITADPSAHVETRTFAFRVGPGEDGKVKVEPVEPGNVAVNVQATAKQFQALAAARCASCHTGQEAKGKFQIAQYVSLAPAAKAKVWERLVAPDGMKRMPRAKDGGPGHMLAPAEIALFLAN